MEQLLRIFFVVIFMVFSGLCVDLSGQTFISPVNESIPDNGCSIPQTTLTDTIDLTGMNLGTLDQDILLDSICLTIFHTFNSDVDIRLYHGGLDGESIDISTDNGFRGEDYLGTCFYDDADTLIVLGTPPYDGTYMPEEPLARFDGLAADTFWIITVCDDEADFTGSFEEWSISFGPPPICRRHEVFIANITGPDTVELVWDGLDPDSVFFIYVDTVGFDPDTLVPFITTDTNFIFSNGAEAGVYEAYLRSICKSGDTSGYSGPLQFVFPYENDFCSNPDSVIVGECVLSRFYLDNTFARDEQFAPPSCETFDDEERDLWYTFVAPDTSIFIRIDSGNAGAAHVAIYDSCGPDHEIFCLEGMEPGDNLVTGLTPGLPYLLRFYTEIQERGAYNICLVPTTSCFPPYDYITRFRDQNSAIIDWLPSTNAAGYLVYAGPAGFNPLDSTPVFTADTSFQFINGSPNEAYDLYVQSPCLEGDTSYLSNPYRFFTKPVNDECVGAIDLDSLINRDDTCNLTVLELYNHLGATYSSDVGPPSSQCADADTSPVDIWFKSSGIENRVLEWQFLTNPGISSIVEVYTGSCPDGLQPLEPVDCTNEQTRTLVNLPSSDTVYYRVWDFGSDDTGPMEICIKADSCPAPYFLEATDETFNSANLEWHNILSANEYLLYVDLAGFEPISGNGLAVLDTLFNYQNAAPNTIYEFYVQSVCTNGDTSVFSLPGEFETDVFCQPPNNIDVDSIRDTSAFIHWVMGLNAVSYIVRVGESGFDPDTIQGVTTVDSSIYFNDAEALTTYDIYVQSVCSNGDTSIMFGPVSFTTTCAGLMGDRSDVAINVNSFPFEDVRNTDSCYTNIFEGNASADVFYRIQTGLQTDRLQISTCDSMTNFDTYMYLLDSALNQIIQFSDDALDTFCEIELNGSLLFAGMDVDVEPGTVYYLVLEGYLSFEGSYSLSIEEIRLCQDVLTLEGILTTDIYEASQMIIFDGQIPETSDVIFNAPEIEINQNGTINGIFETMSDGCQ